MAPFDPERVGRLETEAWVAYYRRRWPTFLRAAIGLTRQTFGLPWPATLRGAWLVLRANQLWAPPSPGNDPDGARRCMARFYALVAERRGAFDPAEAARLEVEWWRVHREREHDDAALADALAALYAHVYRLPAGDERVRTAARERAAAMRDSDRWVGEGCDRASPLVARERAALIRSYTALRSAVA